MSKIKVIAKESLEAEFKYSRYTWTKGLDYELDQKEDYFTLAANEGQVNYKNSVKDKVMENFKVV